MAQIGTAFAAFYDLMKTYGLSKNVTIATGSDFGRTYDSSGGYGSDHGWGNQIGDWRRRHAAGRRR